jgi:hypothetical protein
VYYETTDRWLNHKIGLVFTLTPNIEINSLSINKLKNSQDDFSKYDIEVSLDETENSDSGVKLNYKLVLLSNPTNIKINVDGMISLQGSDSDVSKQLESDQKNIPIIVNKVYQEIFPLFYIISKSMQIPCPAHMLTQASKTPAQEEVPNTQEYENNGTILTTRDAPSDVKSEPPTPDSADESQESSVSSN